MEHETLGLDTLNTPMTGVKLTKCKYCKGQSAQGYYCKFTKKAVYYWHPCSPLFELICPRAKRAKG